jgi:flagellar biosynthesis/type III secretory pathway chaperone
MEQQTRYATETDFGGRLSYLLPDAEGQKIGMGPMPELWDLNAITHSVETLRKTFEWLEHAGVRIPTAYGLTDDYEEEPKQGWQDLLKQIDQSAYYLDSIVSALLDEESRYTTAVCCG